MRYLLLFILFIPFSGLKAQTKTISGTVTDINSEKLVGINIYLSSNKTIGTVSDINGDFTLNINTEYPFRIEISGIGYETTSILIKSSDDLRKIVNEVLNSNQKTILLAIYNNQNQRRYIGIKLD